LEGHREGSNQPQGMVASSNSQSRIGTAIDETVQAKGADLPIADRDRPLPLHGSVKPRPGGVSNAGMSKSIIQNRRDILRGGVRPRWDPRETEALATWELLDFENQKIYPLFFPISISFFILVRTVRTGVNKLLK
jgi:hypothetical protein